MAERVPSFFIAVPGPWEAPETVVEVLRALERWPDHRHHPEDGRHNPFGLWRLLPPEDCRLSASKVAPTIMPSLAALLTRVEAQKGSALTRDEVERIVADSPAVVMDLADVIELERSRGYADIEPQLAWEQWQLIRED